MKIFLTGITGLVGSAFTTLLLSQREDIEIVCLVRAQANVSTLKRAESIIRDQCAFDGVPELADKILPRISVIEGDVTSINPETMAQDPILAGVDTVFHCAADVNLGKDPEGKVFRINYDGTCNVIHLAKLLKVKAFHYVATAYVAGKLQGKAMEDTPINSGFNNAYEESKYMAEMEVRKSGIPFTVYRPAIVVGRSTDGRIRKPLAVYRIFEFLGKFKVHCCTKGKLDPFEVTNLGIHFNTSSSEMIYFVPIDLVQKAIARLFCEPVENKAYHITGDRPLSTDKIDKMIRQVLRCSQLFYPITEYKLDESNKDEMLAARLLGDLYPYFSTQIEFDQTNIRAVLRSAMDACQFTDVSLEHMLRSFYKDFFPNIPWMQELMDMKP